MGLSGRLDHSLMGVIGAADRSFSSHFEDVAERLPVAVRRPFRELLGLDAPNSVYWGSAIHGPTSSMLAQALAATIPCNHDADNPMHFITLIDSRWQTSAKRPVINLPALKQRARDCLKTIGFAGIAIAETDLLTCPLSDPDGDQILPHVHAVGFLDQSRARYSVEQLAQSRMLDEGERGIRTATAAVLPTADDVARTLAYSRKHSMHLKRFVPRQSGDGEILRTNRTRQLHLLSRLAQVYSHMRQKDLLFTMGGCSSWLTEACDMLPPAPRRASWFARREIDAIWNEVHEHYGRRTYYRPRITTR